MYRNQKLSHGKLISDLPGLNSFYYYYYFSFLLDSAILSLLTEETQTTDGCCSPSRFRSLPRTVVCSHQGRISYETETDAG